MSDADKIEATNRYMVHVMDHIVECFPGCAVTLLVAPLNMPEGARTNYISNANRKDMLACMKEVVARFEGRVVDAPTARQ